MNILALDTSSSVATIALSKGENLVAEIIFDYQKNHSATLMPMIEEALEKTDMDLEQVDIIAITSGPGSFTGLRIGMATAKTLAQVKNLKLFTIDTLKALAFNLPFAKGKIVPILDAQRGCVYTSMYRWENSNLIQEKEVEILDIKKLLENLKNEDEVILVGEAVNLYKKEIQQYKNILLAPIGNRASRASGIINAVNELYEKDFDYDYKKSEILYIRKSQAEVQYEEKMGKK